MSVKCLDHVIDKDGTRPQPKKLDIIREWKSLKMKLIFVVSGCLYIQEEICERCCPYCSPTLSSPQQIKFVWTSISMWLCFEQPNKEIVCSSVTLKLPDGQGRFIVSHKASDKAVGFVLKQSDASGSRRPTTGQFPNTFPNAALTGVQSFPYRKCRRHWAQAFC